MESDENNEMTETYGSKENYDSKENLISVENNEKYEIQEESGELQEGEISRSVLKVNFPYLVNL